MDASKPLSGRPSCSRSSPFPQAAEAADSLPYRTRRPARRFPLSPLATIGKQPDLPRGGSKDSTCGAVPYPYNVLRALSYRRARYPLRTTRPASISHQITLRDLTSRLPTRPSSASTFSRERVARCLTRSWSRASPGPGIGPRGTPSKYQNMYVPPKGGERRLGALGGQNRKEDSGAPRTPRVIGGEGVKERVQISAAPLPASRV